MHVKNDPILKTKFSQHVVSTASSPYLFISHNRGNPLDLLNVHEFDASDA